MAKRGANIYKRKDGRWEGRIRRTSLGGLPKYHSVYGRTYREVKEKMAHLLSLQKADSPECVLTVSQVLWLWIRDRRGGWKESTYACYRQIMERYLLCPVGDIRADSFTNAAFQNYLDGLCRKADGKKVSASYARNIGSILRQAFRHAVSEYRYPLPVLSGRRSQTLQKHLELPSDEEIQRLSAYLKARPGDGTCMGILLACHTGIRIGELCALTWEEIDLEEGILRIHKNLQRVKDYDSPSRATSVKVQLPKTASSLRSIPIPDPLLALLKSYPKDGREYLIQGSKTPWAEVRTVQYRFAAILKKCGLKHFRFHMLRHYFASRCIRCGFDAKSLSEILGHSQVQVTLNLYVHSTMERKRMLLNQMFE